MEEAEPFTPHLMQEMKADKRSMFIVKASSIPHHIFTDDVLKKNGKDLSVVWLLLRFRRRKKIGYRFGLLSYSEVTRYLEQFHVKDSERPPTRK